MKLSVKKIFSTLAVAATLVTTSSVFAAPTSGIDWTSNVITAVGIGVPPANSVNAVQATGLAKTAAKSDAYRQLAEIVKGVNVDAETTVEKMMTTSDVVNTHVNAMIRGAKIISEEVIPEGGYAVTMQVPLFGVSDSLASNVLQRPSIKVPFPDPVETVAPSIQPYSSTTPVRERIEIVSQTTTTTTTTKYTTLPMSFSNLPTVNFAAEVSELVTLPTPPQRTVSQTQNGQSQTVKPPQGQPPQGQPPQGQPPQGQPPQGQPPQGQPPQGQPPQGQPPQGQPPQGQPPQGQSKQIQFPQVQTQQGQVAQSQKLIPLNPQENSSAKKTSLKSSLAQAITGAYTGLIVDCRGLDLKAVMSPVIENENGDKIYGHQNLDYDKVVEIGMAAYSTDMTNVERAGTNPLVIKAVAVANHNGNPVLSVADSNRVLIENQSTKFLEDLNVVFLN